MNDFTFLGMSDTALMQDLTFTELLLTHDEAPREADKQQLLDRIKAIKIEQARRSQLPQVWVVTSVWSATDESDSFGEYPLSTLALFENEDDAKKFAMSELANHDLTREQASEDDPDDEDDDDVAPVQMTEKGDGWEAEVKNSYENVWIEVRKMGVR